MGKFPIDAPKSRVVRALEILGFRIVREREHIAMERINPDKTVTTLSLPNHPKIKSSTLRTICSLIGVTREEFLRAYDRPDR